MRFTEKALRELKIEKTDKFERINGLSELIKHRVEYLWEPLIRVITHTILNCVSGQNNNKYFKPFFSDADNTNETYIGQLNLDQVVLAVKKMESQDRSLRGSEVGADENIDKMKKARSLVDSEGTRTIVQIIKAPEGLNGGIGMQRKNTEPLGLFTESPSKISRLHSEPTIQVGGFSTVFKPRSNQKHEEEAQKCEEDDRI